MADSQEQHLRAELDKSTGFVERQRLLKALWKLKRPAAGAEPKGNQSAHAA